LIYFLQRSVQVCTHEGDTAPATKSQ